MSVTNQGHRRGAHDEGQRRRHLQPARYAARHLQPFSIPAAGSFAQFSERNVQIEVNRQVRVDVTLQAGTVETQVQVTDALPQLQTESAEVNAEISSTEIAEFAFSLPLRAAPSRLCIRSFPVRPQSLSKTPTALESVTSRVTQCKRHRVTTATPQRIDGAVNYYGWLPYLIAYVPPADSVENVSVTTNSFNAEQGQAGRRRVPLKSPPRAARGSFMAACGSTTRMQPSTLVAYTATQASLVSPH